MQNELSLDLNNFLFVHGEASKCETLAKSVGRIVMRESLAPSIGTTLDYTNFLYFLYFKVKPIVL